MKRYVVAKNSKSQENFFFISHHSFWLKDTYQVVQSVHLAFLSPLLKDILSCEKIDL